MRRSSVLFVLASCLLVAGCTLVPQNLPGIANGVGAGLIIVGASLYAILAGRAANAAMDKDLVSNQVQDVQRTVARIERRLGNGDS